MKVKDARHSELFPVQEARLVDLNSHPINTKFYLHQLQFIPILTINIKFKLTELCVDLDVLCTRTP